jgi:hypothetical protein
VPHLHVLNAVCAQEAWAEQDVLVPHKRMAVLVELREKALSHALELASVSRADAIPHLSQ